MKSSKPFFALKTDAASARLCQRWLWPGMCDTNTCNLIQNTNSYNRIKHANINLIAPRALRTQSSKPGTCHQSPGIPNSNIACTQARISNDVSTNSGRCLGKGIGLFMEIFFLEEPLELLERLLLILKALGCPIQNWDQQSKSSKQNKLKTIRGVKSKRKQRVQLKKYCSLSAWHVLLCDVAYLKQRLKMRAFIQTRLYDFRLGRERSLWVSFTASMIPQLSQRNQNAICTLLNKWEHKPYSVKDPKRTHQKMEKRHSTTHTKVIAKKRNENPINEAW